MKDVHVKTGFALIIIILIIPSISIQKNDLDCCFMAILSWLKTTRVQNRTLWRTPSEMMKNCEKRKDIVDPCPDGVEILLKETTKTELSQFLKLLIVMKVRLKITIFVNPSEFWSSKTETFGFRRPDLSWHFPILVTIRGLPFKNFPRKVTREVESQERT